MVKIIQDFQFGSGRGNVLSTQNKDEVKTLVKLLNEQSTKNARITDLAFDSFVEFIVQVAHILYNSYCRIDATAHPTEFVEGSKKHLLAKQLVEKFWQQIFTVNEQKNLGYNFLGGDFFPSKT